MKQEFEMLQSEMDKIISINKATSNTVMIIGGVDMSNNLTKAINAYWLILGDKYGFKQMTVEGSSKGKLFFLAEPKPIVKPKTQTEIEIDKYLSGSVKESIGKIIIQFKKVGYTDKIGHKLEMNIAFLALEKLTL